MAVYAWPRADDDEYTFFDAVEDELVGLQRIIERCGKNGLKGRSLDDIEEEN